jgi:hypothetical protein
MIVGQEVSEILSAEGQPTKAVLAQTCMGVFIIHQYLMQFLLCLFFRNRLRTAEDQLVNRRGPQFEKHCYRLCSVDDRMNDE